jgi:dTDP-4-amino-4,6-dideoxygalactose transaminase
MTKPDPASPADAPAAAVPVMRPRLPTADRLLPYLRRIDASRVYSNYGPLVLELEARLADNFGLASGNVVTAGSGLSAIVGAILAGAGRGTTARPLALLPAYTFIATAVAAEQCGYQPTLADVDAQTWLLDPERALQHPDLDRIGLVLPVATLGRAVPVAAWEDFSARTGIPVVIDGAASFEQLSADPARYTGRVPVALSFHATKSFGTGEGGCVVSTDAPLMARVASALNFALHTDRNCQAPSTNGKMSEYHAAVGLAELDGWPAKQQAVERVCALYRREFARHGLAAQLHVAPDIGSSYVLLLARDGAQADACRAAMAAAGVDFRLWYGRGLHGQDYYAGLPRTDLRVTDDLAPRLLGLPFAPDLAEAEIVRVAQAIAVAIPPGPVR